MLTFFLSFGSFKTHCAQIPSLKIAMSENSRLIIFYYKKLSSKKAFYVRWAVLPLKSILNCWKGFEYCKTNSLFLSLLCNFFFLEYSATIFLEDFFLAFKFYLLIKQGPTCIYFLPLPWNRTTSSNFAPPLPQFIYPLSLSVTIREQVSLPQEELFISSHYLKIYITLFETWNSTLIAI